MHRGARGALEVLEEALLVVALAVLAVAGGLPLGLLLRHALELVEPRAPQPLHVVLALLHLVEHLQLLVQLLLGLLQHAEQALADDLLHVARPAAAAAAEGAKALHLARGEGGSKEGKKGFRVTAPALPRNADFSWRGLLRLPKSRTYYKEAKSSAASKHWRLTDVVR